MRSNSICSVIESGLQIGNLANPVALVIPTVLAAGLAIAS